MKGDDALALDELPDVEQAAGLPPPRVPGGNTWQRRRVRHHDDPIGRRAQGAHVPCAAAPVDEHGVGTREQRPAQQPPCPAPPFLRRLRHGGPDDQRRRGCGAVEGRLDGSRAELCRHDDVRALPAQPQQRVVRQVDDLPFGVAVRVAAEMLERHGALHLDPQAAPLRTPRAVRLHERGDPHPQVADPDGDGLQHGDAVGCDEVGQQDHLCVGDGYRTPAVHAARLLDAPSPYQRAVGLLAVR
jgi:hypothetical protein